MAAPPGGLGGGRYGCHVPDDAPPTEPAAADHRWWQVRALVEAGAADLVADALWQRGAAGIEERTAPDGRLLLVAGFDGADGTAERTATAAAALVATTVGDAAEARAVPVVDDGLDAWRAHAGPERAGGWWLVPAWIEPSDPPPDIAPDHVLLVDPGRTFGSGSHPTTRRVLAALDAVVRPGAVVLDVGTGSGVLALAAARLGARTVVATDIDPASAEVVAANAERNGVGDRIAYRPSPLAAIVADGARFDVVLANLLAPVIAALADDLRAAVAPGGRLVASGLLADRWEVDVSCLAPLRATEVTEEDGWVAVVLALPDPVGR